MIQRLLNLFRDLRSNAAYRRFQRERDAELKAAQAKHAPTREIVARRQAGVHAALRGGR